MRRRVRGSLAAECIFALLFRILPDVQLRWKDVTTGAFVTAVLHRRPTLFGAELTRAYADRRGMTLQTTVLASTDVTALRHTANLANILPREKP